MYGVCSPHILADSLIIVSDIMCKVCYPSI